MAGKPISGDVIVTKTASGYDVSVFPGGSRVRFKQLDSALDLARAWAEKRRVLAWQTTGESQSFTRVVLREHDRIA